MFKIEVKQEIINHCRQQISTYNFGKRVVANGNSEQQLTGIIGQSVIMDLFGLGYINGENGFDDGVDISYNNLSIDVKTMGRTTEVRDYYVNNFIGLQLYFKTDIYIFCSFNKNTQILTVCGWIEKADFLKKSNLFPKGTTRKRSDGSTFRTFADLYEISNKDLNNVNSFEELKSELDKIKKVN